MARKLTRLFALMLTLLPVPALAQDVALILGQNRYDAFGRAAGAGQVPRAADDLRALGFDVTASTNGRAANTVATLNDFADRAAEAERIVIVLAGRFVTDGQRSWLLLADADYPTLFGMGEAAVPIETMLNILRQRPGQAVLVLGHDRSDDGSFGPYLRAGIGSLDIPQGVTVVSGAIGRASDFVRDRLTRPGEDLIDAAKDLSLTVSGFAPAALVLMPDAQVDVVVPDLPPAPDPELDRRRWALADRADTAEGYRAYLDSTPNGAFAEEARDRIEAILAEPFRAERLAEEALDLSRNDRREIQRHLTLLGFNTRGIDGIFGGGSRGAIRSWQQENGYPQSSYLNREQIARLAGQAVRRQSEIDAADEAEQRARQRADRAFWDETGARGDEAGYRAYLDRYPQGLFAETATQALAEIDRDRRDSAAAADRTAWDRARSLNTERAYRDYLAEFPRGAFRTEAQAALALVTQPSGPSEEALDAARAEERSLRLNPITARLIEAKLADLGLQPGTVDGRFTDRTRAAIRRYQQARGLPVTGYLTEATVVRLLADSINGLQRN